MILIIILLINADYSINANYSALNEKIKINPTARKFKVDDRVRITKYKNNFRKGYTENWSKEYLFSILLWKLQKKVFIIDSAFKTNPWTYKIKDLNEKIIVGSFYQK